MSVELRTGPSANGRPRHGAVTADAALLRSMRDRLAAAGVSDPDVVLLIEFEHTGFRVSALDASTGSSVAERHDGALCPAAVDTSLARYLLARDIVAPRSTASDDTGDAGSELLAALPGVRQRLGVAPATFAMAGAGIGLFRVTRADVDAATARQLDTAERLCRLAAAAAVRPGMTRSAAPVVSAVVMMPEHREWPGLAEYLGSKAPVPVVDLNDPSETTRTSGRHKASAVQHDGASVPSAPSIAESPDSFGGVPSGRGGPVHGSPIDPGASHPGAGARVVRPGAGPRYYSPSGAESERTTTGSRSHDRRLGLGIGAVVAFSAVGAVIVAVPFVGPSHGDITPAPRQAAATSPADATSTSPVPAAAATGQTTPSRAPVDIGAARQPLRSYTSPRPAPPAQTQAAPTRSTPTRTRTVPRPPRQRTIPNPIPGLPPIVLP